MQLSVSRFSQVVTASQTVVLVVSSHLVEVVYVCSTSLVSVTTLSVSDLYSEVSAEVSTDVLCVQIHTGMVVLG